MPETETEADDGGFSCGQCGALLEFQPGAALLACRHCGAETPLPDTRSS